MSGRAAGSVRAGWLSGALAGLLVMGAAQAAPYSWKGPVAPVFRAPTDQVSDGAWRGASLQGGLVDIRYGQVCVDLGGVGEVLETDESSVLTLNGSPVTPEELLKHIPDDLAVAVRFSPETGKVGWLDAYNDGQGLPAAALAHVRQAQGPAYGALETLTLTMTSREKKRLSGQSFTATIPGVAHDLPLLPTRDGGSKVVLRVLPGWNYQEVPVFIKAVRGDKAKIYIGPRLSFSTTGPEVEGFGPQTAARETGLISGWVDLRSESDLLDPATARIKVPPGVRVMSFQPRVDRSVFELETEGPGDYWIEFSMADRMGRKVRQGWTLKVLP